VLLGVTRITFETPMPRFSVTITGHSSLPGLVVTQSSLFERIATEGQRVRSVKLGKTYLSVWSYVLWIGKSFPNLSFIVLRPHSRSARAR